MVRSLRQNAQGAWQAAATYLTGPRGMEYRRDDLAGTVRWYVYDGLGSVVGELDPSGNLTAGKKYDVYGAERTGGTGTASSRQGYVGSLGHIADAETGLVYMRARYYDPNVGRFVSEDPGAHGLNWFIYCSNNPVNSIDPDGRAETMTGQLTTMNIGFGSLYAGIAGAVFSAVLDLLTKGTISSTDVAMGFLGGLCLNLGALGVGAIAGRLGADAVKTVCFDVACTTAPKSLGEFALHVTGAAAGGAAGATMVGALLALSARTELVMIALE